MQNVKHVPIDKRSSKSMRKQHSISDFSDFLRTSTVNYRYNVIDGTLKKLRYIRFYVIPVWRNFAKTLKIA